MIVRIINAIWSFMSLFSILRVVARAPKDEEEMVRLMVGDRYTITTGKSKIQLRYKKGRILEILLVPAAYVEKNWEGVNDEGKWTIMSRKIGGAKDAKTR